MNNPEAFVVVSTEQNLANLPPILELAHPGDVVLWVESPVARRNQWSKGTREVLNKHGLEHWPQDVEIDDINDPSQISKSLRPFVTELAQTYALNVVANGGQKFTPIGILKAFDGLRFQWLYSQPKPAELWIFDGAMLKAPQRKPYKRHKLDFEDILATREMVIQSVDMAATNISGTESRYGLDLVYTAQIHDEHYQYGSNEGDAESQPIDITTFEDIGESSRHDRMVRDAHSKWLNANTILFQHAFAKGRRQSVKRDWPQSKIVEHLREKTGLMKSLYQTTISLAKAATAAKNRVDQHLDPPTIGLGHAFERAVTARVLAHLKTNPDQNRLVQQILTKANVAQTRSPATTRAEWDIVLVLKNAVLLVIECKSFGAKQKDLDARLLNLLRAGSQTEMLVCGPLYTEFTDRPWFPAMHQFREKIGVRNYVPFTLPGQRTSYMVTNVQGEEEEHHCPSFEEVLGKRLEQYVPKG